MAEKTNIDWDDLLPEDAVHQAGEDAAQQTDAELSEKIAALTSLTKKDIEDTFPAKSDKEKLVALMQVVDSAKTRQDKMNAIVDNAEEFAGIILSLLSKFL